MKTLARRYTSKASEHLPAIIAALASLIGLYLRSQDFARRPLNGDELFSVTNATGPLPPFWQKLSIGGLISFPGHYLSLWPLGQVFGANKWALAFPHIVAAICGFFLLYRASRLFLRTPLGYAACFSIVSFNGTLIFHSFELRSYGVLATLAIACFYLSKRLCNNEQRPSLRIKLLASLVFVATTFYHAYGLLIVLLSLVFSALDHPKTINPGLHRLWQEHRTIMLPTLLLALFIFIWYGTGYHQPPSSRNIHTFDFIPDPLSDAVGFSKNIIGNLLGNKLLYIFLPGPILSWLLPHKDRLRQTCLLLIMVLCPISLILISDIKGSYWFIQRQFIWTVPFFALWVGWCWDSVWIKTREWLNNRQ